MSEKLFLKSVGYHSPDDMPEGPCVILTGNHEATSSAARFLLQDVRVTPEDEEPTAAAAEWNSDMSEAPRDGTPLLVWAFVRGWEDAGKTRCVAWWDGYSWAAYGPAFGEPSPEKVKPGSRARYPQRITACIPTHWRMLPPAPTEGK